MFIQESLPRSSAQYTTKIFTQKLKVEISGHKRECDIVIALLRGKAKIMIFTKRVSFAISPEKVNIDTFMLTLTN